MWDVTSFYPENGTTYYIVLQGACMPVQLGLGGDVTRWLANQTAYAIVRCDATSASDGPTGTADSNDASSAEV
jgi:hypothetical protein